MLSLCECFQRLIRCGSQTALASGKLLQHWDTLLGANDLEDPAGFGSHGLVRMLKLLENCRFRHWPHGLQCGTGSASVEGICQTLCDRLGG